MSFPIIKQIQRELLLAFLALLGTLLISLKPGNSVEANNFSVTPLFQQVSSYETTIGDHGDPSDIYFPVSKSKTDTKLLPIALCLQGTFVDKSNYSEFASIVARYGFVVVVPNNLNDVLVPFGFPEGFFSEQEQVNQVLDYMKKENRNPDSPVFKILDPSKLVLLGHSSGGVVGLNAIQGTCILPYCKSEFTRPKELVGGAFYGSDFNLLGQFEQTPPIENDGIPIAILAGTLDGLAAFDSVKETYNQIQELPKSFISIIGANHYSITNTNNPVGTVPDRNVPTIDRNIGIETLARWSALFLRANILQDKDAFNYIYRVGDSFDSNVSVINQTH